MEILVFSCWCLLINVSLEYSRGSLYICCIIIMIIIIIAGFFLVFYWSHTSESERSPDSQLIASVHSNTNENATVQTSCTNTNDTWRVRFVQSVSTSSRRLQLLVVNRNSSRDLFVSAVTRLPFKKHEFYPAEHQSFCSTAASVCQWVCVVVWLQYFKILVQIHWSHTATQSN